MSIKIITNRQIVSVQVIASLLLLSSCGGDNSPGGSTEGDLADDDCTSTTNLSTQLVTEVDINGNISMVPVANNTISSDCGSSSTEGDFFDSDLIQTRFENSEDFDIWDCIGTDGSSRQYSLFSFDDLSDYSFWRYAVEIDPAAEDLTASQQLYGWRVFRSPNADTLTLRTWERIGVDFADPIESEWTGITFATEDNMSFTSSIEGAMQCTRTFSTINLDAERFFVPCELRPLECCRCEE